MLLNETLIHRLTLKQKLNLVISNKKDQTTEVDDYEFPVLSFFNANFNKNTIFPSTKSLVNCWNLSLIEKLYKNLSDINKMSDGNFIKFNCSINGEDSTDPYFLSQQLKNKVKGISDSKDRVVLEKEDDFSNFDITMLPLDEILKENEVKYIIVNNVNEMNYLKKFDKFKNKFIGKTSFLDVAVSLIVNGASLILYTGNYDELLENLENRINLFNTKHKEYLNKDITVATYNALLESGEIIPVSRIDELCDEIIEEFKSLKKENNLNNTISSIELNELSYELSKESIVLLKNENNILPLNLEDKVAFIGESFKETKNIESGYNLLKSYDEINAIGFAHGYIGSEEANIDLITKATLLCKDANKIVVYLKIEKEETKLSENKLDLLNQLSTLSLPIICVLLTDHYIDLDFANLCSSIILSNDEAKFSHKAILDCLCNKNDFSGRLGREYSILLEDKNIDYIPSYCKDNPIYYPFGYGLSYTDVIYSGLELNNKFISFIITNKSKFNGVCIPQIYISKPGSKKYHTFKLLKEYRYINIASNESIKISIPLEDKFFEYYDEVNNKKYIEEGEYEVFVGNNSEDIKLHGFINLDGNEDKEISFESKLEIDNLSDLDIIKFKENVKTKNKLKRKTKNIITILALVYFNAIFLYIFNFVRLQSNVKDNLTIICILINVILFITLILFNKKKKEVKASNKVELLSDVAKNIETLNPIVTFTYDEVDNEMLQQNKEEKEEKEEVKEEKTEEVKDDTLEEVIIPKEEEEVINTYDEQSSLSYEEIEKYEQEEMKILEEQENSNEKFEDFEKEEIVFDTESDMTQVLNNFMLFAKEKGLLLEVNSARNLLSALMSTKMIFVRTNKEDKTDQLLNIINEFFQSKSRIIEASDNWASLFSISWIKDENGQYQKTNFIEDMYKATLLKDNFNLCILKNVSLDNFNLYFDKCISYAYNPSKNYALNISKNIKVYIPSNMHFIINPKDRNYINKLDERLIDSCLFVDILILNTIEPKEEVTPFNTLSNNYCNSLLKQSLKTNFISENNWKKIDELLDEINKIEKIELNNKSVIQIENFAALFKNCGGDDVDLLDLVLSTKIIPLIKTLDYSKTNDGINFIKDILEHLFNSEDIKRTLISLQSK